MRFAVSGLEHRYDEQASTTESRVEHSLGLELLRDLHGRLALRLQLREQLRVLEHLRARRARDVRARRLAVVDEVACMMM